MLMRDRDTVYVGHVGAMPGFLSAVVCHPPTQLGVVVLVNTSGGLHLGALAVQLLSLVREAYPAAPEWTPGGPPPDRIASLLGRWWSEWNEWIFRWRNGQLQPRLADAPPGDPPTEFADMAPVSLWHVRIGTRRAFGGGQGRLGGIGRRPETLLGDLSVHPCAPAHRPTRLNRKASATGVALVGQCHRSRSLGMQSPTAQVACEPHRFLRG